MSIEFCPYNAPARQIGALGSSEKLYDVVQAVGALGNCKVILDFGDPLSYSGTTQLGTTEPVDNRVDGYPDYTTDRNSYFNLLTPYYKSFIHSPDQEGFGPNGDTRPWSDTFHKAGGAISWCAIVKVNVPNGAPLFGTWNNTTSSTGFNTWIGNGGFSHTAWRNSNRAALTMSYSHVNHVTDQWMFIASTFGDGVTSFARLNDTYYNIDNWREGVNSNTVPVNAPTHAEPYYAPSGNNATSGLIVLGIPGSNNPSGDISLGCIAVWDDVISETSFNLMFNALRGRYGI